MLIVREGFYFFYIGVLFDFIGVFGGFYGVGFNYNYWVVVNDMFLSDVLVVGM